MAQILFKSDFAYTSESRNKGSWLDLKLFHEVLVSYNGYGEVTGITDKAGCFFWICNNLSHTIIIDDPPSPSGHAVIHFYFSHEEDLLRFKLSEWGAQCLAWTDK